MKKTIQLTVEQAREMLGKDEAMDALIRANFTEQELKPRVKRWEDLGKIDGWYIEFSSVIYELKNENCTPSNRNIYAKKTQAEGVLAMAQLSQLKKEVNGDWKPDWKNDEQRKFVIENLANEMGHDLCFHGAKFLAFPTAEIRDKFAKDHEELILEYFKIYE